jgi:glutathione S-transferase
MSDLVRLTISREYGWVLLLNSSPLHPLFLTPANSPVMSDLVRLTISREYGWVLLTTASTTLLNMWLARQVGNARKKYKVDYPTMYDPAKPEFNCYQRAHQNMLETLPNILAMLLIGGIRHPRIATGAGLTWILGRILFAFGYYTGDPSKRHRGSILIFPSMLVLLGTAVSTAFSVLNIF